MLHLPFIVINRLNKTETAAEYFHILKVLSISEGSKFSDYFET